MSLLNTNIPSYSQGISQQEPATRLDTQCEELINAVPSLVYGNIRRNPTEYIATLTSNYASNSFTHPISRDSEEEYISIITEDATNPIEVFKIDGTKCTIRYGNLDENLAYTSDTSVKDYLLSSNPKDELKAVTIADNTIISNNSVSCSMLPATSYEKVNEAIVYIKKGVAEQSYKIFLDDKLYAIYTTGNTTNYASYRSNWIAENLSNQIISTKIYTLDYVKDGLKSITIPNLKFLHISCPDYEHAVIQYTVVGNVLTIDGVLCSSNLSTIAGSDGTAFWLQSCKINIATEATTTINSSSVIIDSDIFYNTEVNGSTIKIWRKDGADFKIATKDSYSNEAMVCVKDKIDSYNKLPSQCFDNFTVNITGDTTNLFDNYWVKYIQENTSGYWKEIVDPTISVEFDSSTMPHRLVRTGVNEFTFAPIIWNKRNVGDDITCPVPSFINNTINNISFFRSRLVFLSGENVIMSKTNDFFNFFRTTALDTLDDDCIDISVVSPKVNILKNSIATVNSLLVFGDQVQGVITSGNKNTLTPKTVSADITTQFTINNTCQPISVGSNTYMCVNAGNWTGIKEYFLTADTINYDAADITAHVPRYIPNNAQKMVGSSIYDMLFVQTSNEPSNLYVYKYYWTGDTKIQSAWSTWNFSGEICSYTIIYDYLYLLIKRNNTIYLEKVCLDITNSGSLDYNVFLDRKCLLSGSFNSTTNTTSWNLPYTTLDSETYKAVNSVTGNPVLSLTKSGTTVYCKGNYSSDPYFIGTTYNRKLILSKFIFRDKDGKNRYGDGKLNVRKFRLFYDKTGGLKFTIKIKGRDDDVVDFTNVIVGQSIIDDQIVSDGYVDIFPFSDPDNLQIVIENDSHKPDILVSGTYQFSYTSKSKKI